MSLKNWFARAVGGLRKVERAASVAPYVPPAKPIPVAAAAVVPEPLPPVTHPPSRVSQAGIDLLHHFEGFHRDIGGGKVRAYPDPATGGEPYTIGYGSTGRDPFNGGRIGPNTVWTHEQARQRFRDHLRQFEREVAALITAPTTQSQFDAITSLVYNTGVNAIRRSTLIRKHNAGDHKGAADEFRRWVFAGGKRMRGLVRRREAERQLYLTGSWTAQD